MNVKKAICLVGLLGICLPLSAAADFSLALQGGVLFPGDSGYRDIYGSSCFFPGVKAQVSITDSLYAWGGYWHLSGSGATPVLQAEADSTQGHIAFGAGWSSAPSGKGTLRYYAEAGVLLVHFTEKSMGVEVSGNATGLRVATGIQYDVSANFFIGAGVSWSGAQKEIEDVKIKLGGVGLLLEAGVRF